MPGMPGTVIRWMQLQALTRAQLPGLQVRLHDFACDGEGWLRLRRRSWRVDSHDLAHEPRMLLLKNLPLVQVSM